MNSKVIYGIGALVVVAVLGFAAFASMGNNENQSTESQSESSGDQSTESGQDEQEGVSGALASPTAGEGSAESAAVTITFSDDGYDKDSYEAKVGEAIAVKNESSSETQFSSDVHPTHIEESELNLPVQAPGETVTFSVTEAGTYGFHDHLNSSKTGVLVVK